MFETTLDTRISGDQIQFVTV